MKLTMQNLPRLCELLAKGEVEIVAFSGAGEQASLMSESVNQIKNNLSAIFEKTNTTLETNIVNGDEINDESLLENIFAIQPMFADKNVIVVHNLKPNVAEAFLTKCLAFNETIDEQNNNIVLLWTNAIIKKSTKKTAIEGSSQIAIIDCYADNNSTIETLAKTLIKQNGFEIFAPAMQLLIESCKGNRFYLQNELEKLFTYKFAEKKITLGDVELLVVEGGVDNAFNKCDEILLLDPDKLEKIFENIKCSKGSDGQISSLIFILKNNLMFLRSMWLAAKQSGTGVEDQLKAELSKNRAFFLKIDIVRAQLKIWSFNKINIFLVKLAELEIASRQNYSISNTIAENLFFEESLQT